MAKCSTDPDGYPFDPAETARLSRLRLAREWERCRMGLYAASLPTATLDDWGRRMRLATAELVAAMRQDNVRQVVVEDMGLLLRLDAAGEIVRDKFDKSAKFHVQPKRRPRK